jgi:hypothetical protein
MRCARCDRLAIPQAVGLSPEGLVVFGWCLDCLEEAGCTDVEVVERRSDRRGPPRVSSLGSIAPRPALDRRDRRRLFLGVTLLLSIWSIVLIAGGIRTIRQPPAPNPSPLGNGSPLLLLAGGAATATTSLLLLVLSHGRALLRSRRAWLWVQSGSFLLALAILFAGIVYHDPRRDPFVVAAAGLALGVSVGAHWRERRLPAATARTGTRISEWIRRV